MISFGQLMGTNKMPKVWHFGQLPDRASIRTSKKAYWSVENVSDPLKTPINLKIPPLKAPRMFSSLEHHRSIIANLVL